MGTILFSISSPGREQELTTALKDDHRIHRAESPNTAEVDVPAVDLWVLDLRQLRNLGIDTLQGFKKEASALASPVLLLAPESRLSQLDSALWDHVDEVIGTPLKQSELTGRVRVLLRMRQYSVEAEEARRRASSKYKALFDSSAHGILLLSEGRVAEANRRAGKLFGRPPEMLVGESVSALSEDAETGSEEETGTVEALLRQVQEKGEVSTEWKFAPPASEPFWADFTLTLLSYGGKEYVQAVFRDVTPRRKARKELEESQDLLSRTQKVAEIGGWRYEPENDQLVGTDELARLLGRAEADRIDLEEGLDYFPPDAREEARERVRRCLQEKEAFDLEVPFLTETGEKRWGRLRGQARLDEAGVTRMVGTLQDITERKEAERELRRSRERLATAERIAKLGSWEYDLKREELHWSEQTRQIFGWLEEEPITGEAFMAAVHPDDRDRLQRAQEAAFENGTHIDVEYRIVRPDGEERIIHERAEPAFGEEGEPIRLSGAVLDVTERRQREKKIDRLRKKYRSLLKGAPDAIFVAESESGRITEANRAAADLLETTVGEITGRHQSELHPPEERERYRDFFDKHMRASEHGQETFTHFEDGSPLLVVTDSGKQVPVEISASLVELEGKNYFVGIFRDVSRRRRAERRRRVFEKAVEHSGDAIFITDPEGEIRYVNPATEEITGYEEEELLGATPCLFQSGETPEETYAELWETIQRGEVYRNTFTDEAKDGSQIELDEIVVPIEGEFGEIQYYAATGRDVTKQKKTERKLRRSEERFRGVFENAAMGIALLDEKGRMVDTNPALQEMVGYESEELLGTHFGEISHSADLPEDRQRYEELITGKRSRYQMEKRYVRKNGEVFWGRLTVSRHTTDQEGRAIGMVEDINDRKQYEKDLRTAKEEAEKAAQLKSAMLANMSHEVRTPLTAINGFAELLKDDLEGQMQTFANRIYRSGQRLLDTLNSVLQLSRLEAGESDFEKAGVDLTEIANGVAGMLDQKSNDKDIAIALDFPDGPVEMQTSEEAVRRVLENLLSNAIKFTPEEGQVAVRVHETSNQAVLEVEDTGVGIGEKALPEIFQAFKQESEGLSREYEGTGLGLSIVKELTEALGGTVEVESEKWEGTCFTVRLPKKKEEASRQAER